MSGDGVCICGVGMVTAVGGCAAQTTSSVLAGISRYSETDDEDTDAIGTMALLPEDWLPPLHDDLADAGLADREQRMLRLAGPALEEAMTGLPQRQKPALILAIPEAMPDVPLEMGDEVLDHLFVHTSGTWNRAASLLVIAGRAGGLLALHSAISLLDAGAEYALIGGVDTYLDAEVLSALEADDRLLTEGALDGFAPGEGAAFLLLGRREAVERDGLQALGYIRLPGLAQEPGHRYSEVPSRGDGLALAVSSGIAEGDGRKIRTVLCSLNGEQIGAKEWGVAMIRNHDAFEADPAMIHPADCFGDPGAAAGPILIGLGTIAMRSGDLPGPALVWCASDAELRGAVWLEPAQA